jgi:hypothetical protein
MPGSTTTTTAYAQPHAQPCHLDVPLLLLSSVTGVRSCMIEYDQRKLSLPALLDLIERADAAIGDVQVRRPAGRTP